MTFTATQITQLNNSNAAMQRAQVGTLLAGIGDLAFGTYVVTADDQTEGSTLIDTGKEGATVFLVSIYREGVDVKSDALMAMLEGALAVGDGAATYTMTADDVIHYIVL